MSLDGQNLPVRPTMGWFTQSLTLIGLPTVVVPVLVAEQALPIGLPIIAAPWRETDALWAAQQLEGLEATKFTLPRPI
jgi:Asp-tRNA(Asn)/Glu-tRNA(Gln) amidotransferase A subunit family amidase